MMNLIKKNLISLLMILPIWTHAATHDGDWPQWQAFKKYFLSDDGRVIDLHSTEKNTTSEGQSYALFFALVANDHHTFELLLQWTQNNLADGDLSQHLPAWLWGKNKKNEWGILDNNSASDADLWLAYDLLEAGRLWHNPRYTRLGNRLLQQILKEEVVRLPGLGKMVIPGKSGFIHDDYWVLNPSYLPLQLLTRFSMKNRIWKKIKANSLKLLIETSPLGYAPDWVIWKKQQGWQANLKQPHLGGYDAIRVYLWVGMMANDKTKSKLTHHFLPIIHSTEQIGTPPETINTATGELKGDGPIGFSAALLPLLGHLPAAIIQQQHVERFSFSSGEYYNAVLTLFGQGFWQNHYRFDNQGQLVPDWVKNCKADKNQARLKSNDITSPIDACFIANANSLSMPKATPLQAGNP